MLLTQTKCTPTYKHDYKATYVYTAPYVYIPLPFRYMFYITKAKICVSHFTKGSVQRSIENFPNQNILIK